MSISYFEKYKLIYSKKKKRKKETKKE